LINLADVRIFRPYLEYERIKSFRVLSLVDELKPISVNFIWVLNVVAELASDL